MMKKLYTLKQASLAIYNLKQQGKTIVLVGGCFDIIHIGHITFLEKAKAKGDVLVVLLESDEKIRQSKGMHRPVHTQKQRASILAALSCVDIIVTLPYITSHKQYDTIVEKLAPTIIATTKGDTGAVHKKRQAKKFGAKFVYVTNHIRSFSTTALLQALKKEN